MAQHTLIQDDDTSFYIDYDDEYMEFIIKHDTLLSSSSYYHTDDMRDALDTLDHFILNYAEMKRSYDEDSYNYQEEHFNDDFIDRCRDAARGL